MPVDCLHRLGVAGECSRNSPEAFHNRTLVSSPPVASVLPSGTRPGNGPHLCSAIVARSLPVSASQIRTVLSMLAEASSSPSGDQAAAVIASVCPWYMHISTAVVAFQTQSLCVPSPVTIGRPQVHNGGSEPPM